MLTHLEKTLNYKWILNSLVAPIYDELEIYCILVDTSCLYLQSAVDFPIPSNAMHSTSCKISVSEQY